MCLVGDEELRPIAVGPAIGHRQDATLAVLQAVIDLVGELAVGGSIDALPALACACWVTCKSNWREQWLIRRKGVVALKRTQHGSSLQIFLGIMKSMDSSYKCMHTRAHTCMHACTHLLVP